MVLTKKGSKVLKAAWQVYHRKDRNPWLPISILFPSVINYPDKSKPGEKGLIWCPILDDSCHRRGAKAQAQSSQEHPWSGTDRGPMMYTHCAQPSRSLGPKQCVGHQTSAKAVKTVSTTWGLKAF